MRYTKGGSKLLVCEATLGRSWAVSQSMPFLTPAIVHAKGYDSVTAVVIRPNESSPRFNLASAARQMHDR